MFVMLRHPTQPYPMVGWWVRELQDLWPAEQAIHVLHGDGRPVVLVPELSDPDLARWYYGEESHG